MTREAIVRAFVSHLGSENEKDLGGFKLCRMANGAVTVELGGLSSGPLTEMAPVEALALWDQLPESVRVELTEPPVPPMWLNR